MKKPLIGITPFTEEGFKFYKLNTAYVNAVEKAGGIPVILPFNRNLTIERLDAFDGILLSGGGDIYSSFFNQELHEKAGDIDYKRDSFEIELCQRAVDNNIPLLCICRGMQILNVAFGGDILQHIDGHIQQEGRNVPTHNILLECGTKLHEIAGRTEFMVNSFHHQAVGFIGGGLYPAAVSTSEDRRLRVVEAIEAKQGFALGVQWHPEALSDELSIKIFSSFISEASRSG